MVWSEATAAAVLRNRGAKNPPTTPIFCALTCADGILLPATPEQSNPIRSAFDRLTRADTTPHVAPRPSAQESSRAFRA